MTDNAVADPQQVWVVHGRNKAARDAMFTFLRSIGLKPVEFDQAVAMTGKGAPYIGEILDVAFANAQAVVVLLTPDEITYIRREYAEDEADPEYQPAAQARPNVLFEAGMALGRDPDRTILVEFGKVRPFSDVAGRHVLRLDHSSESRKRLAQRLETAGCPVDLSGSDWLSAGDLTPPPPPGQGLPLGRRLPTEPSRGVRLDADYQKNGNSGRLRITNYSSFPVHELRFELPEEAAPGFFVHTGSLPIKKLPPGKTASFVASRTMGGGADHFEISITAETPEGEPIATEAFVSLVS